MNKITQEEADKQIQDVERRYRRGLITEEERYALITDIEARIQKDT